MTTRNRFFFPALAFVALATTAAVTGWATKTLPDVRQHLDQAKQIESKLSTPTK